jgi:dihydropyrimidine dehydrogenase (NAD+) subunit PreA
MADLTTNFAKAFAFLPTPSGWPPGRPPTAASRLRAFDAGGRGVWKTIASHHRQRFALLLGGLAQRMMGLDNIELISDGPSKQFARNRGGQKRYETRYRVTDGGSSAKSGTTSSAVETPVRTAELNFGCHGMSERGMGSAVGQMPDYSCMITEGEGSGAHPRAGQLTPNITDIRAAARAARRSERARPSTPSIRLPASTSIPSRRVNVADFVARYAVRRS